MIGLTRDWALEIARRFFVQTLRASHRYVRMSFEHTGLYVRRVIVSIHYGARDFNVEVNCHDDAIRLSEITTHRRFVFNSRNPLNGLILKEIPSERVIKTHKLSRCSITDKNDEEEARNRVNS